MPSLIFRKGLDLKAVVAGELAEDYHSELVDRIKSSTYRYTSGRLTVYLAREFGFCYGVDRAVDYAYQTRRRFPVRERGEEWRPLFILAIYAARRWTSTQDRRLGC